MPTVKEAVKVFLGDAEACGLASATLQKLRYIFEVQLLGFANETGLTFLNEFNPRNLTEWRQTWREKELARKKKFERVIGFFWFCVRQGWLRENPTATMGRVIAKHVPTDYFTAEEYKCIIDATLTCQRIAELFAEGQQHLTKLKRGAQLVGTRSIVPALEAIHLHLQTKIIDIEFIGFLLQGSGKRGLLIGTML